MTRSDHSFPTVPVGRVPAEERRAVPDGAPKNMVWVPGGDFLMGSADFYPEERPVHRQSVRGFWVDQHPITNAEFRRFVKDTGHVTTAETAPARTWRPRSSGSTLPAAASRAPPTPGATPSRSGAG